MRLFLTIALLLSALSAGSSMAEAQNKAKVERLFNSWLQSELWPKAKSQGVSKRVFDAAFSKVSLQWKLPDLEIPGAPKKKKKAQSQSEFRAPSAYFIEGNLVSQAKSGRALAAKWAGTLKRIEKKYGVPGRFLIAIWGRESAFGKAKIPYSAIDVLATKAFMSTRKALFTDELLAALQIMQRGNANKKQLKGSWAGAMGQPQFMPSSYNKYAVDFDGDGKRDIWNSVPDTLASMANYLAKNGWKRGQDWGFEVSIPNTMSCALEGPDRARPISVWHGAGINRVSGKAFSDRVMKHPGMMLVPSGRSGPHFLVTENFYAIKKYNNSDLYALFVGNLADRIAFGGKAFVRSWPKQPRMYRSDIAQMQRRLEKKGYDVGGADGLPGFKTRRSIGEWQIRKGQQSTCFPTPNLIKSIR